MFQKLLLEHGFNYPIESYLIFINPEFHLYTTTINPSIIFPAQLNRFLKKLNSRPVKLNLRHYKLAEKIASLHITESPYSRVPPYNYDRVKKGILCLICRSFFMVVERDILHCSCGCKESIDAAVMRNVKEYILLFPDRKITTKDIYEWCGGIVSKKTIRRILLQNFKLKGHSVSSHYVSKLW